jgi:Ca2+-binding RTX toxin-like protein
VATSAFPSVLDSDSRASLLTNAVTAADARMVAVVLDALASSSITTSEGTRNYAEFLRDSLGVTNPRAFVESVLSDTGGRSRVLLAAAVENRVNAWQQAMTSAGSAEDLARAITVISVAAKYLEMQSLGDLLDAAGNPAVGQTPHSVVTAIAANADAMSATAQEAIGDVLGVDTRTRYSDAVIRILSDGADDYTGTDASEIIAARRGSNVVRGYGGNDRLLGGSGVDSLSGGEGDDELFGYRGDDVLDGNEGDDFISAGAGNDLINGGTGDDTILGETGDDTIVGGGGSDFILGGGGDDTITVGGNGGQPFSTYVDGGAGTNRLTIAYDGVTSLADFVVRRMGADGVLHLIDANGGEFRIRNFGLTPPTQPQPSTLTIGSRSYQIAGPNAYGGMGSSSPSFGAALSVPTGEAVLYEIEGSEGSTFHARRPWASPPPSDGVMTPVPLDFSSQPWTIQGTSRQDIISGGTQADTIFSRDGNDRIYGRGGADTIAAGGGNDVVFFITPEALATATAIDGGEGQDTLAFGRVVGFDFTTSSTDTPLNVDVMTIGIAVGFENVIGGLANDTVLGNNDANGLLGSSGSDTIHGREGDDTLYGDYEVLFPAWGTGDGFFGYTSNMIDRSIFDQNGTGHDTLLGGAGRDRLFGEGGNDLLDGGTGADIHTGGAGFDTFVLRSGDGGATAAEADVITDFQDGVDVFGLADGLNFQSLVIAQGNGSDTATTNTVIRTTAGEILVVVNNVQATQITVLDFTGLSTAPLTIVGSSGDEVLFGAFGDDTIVGGGGSDFILGGGGDDTITVGGNGGQPFSTYVDGGAGTNRLTIAYDGVTSLADFVVRRMGADGVLHLIDANGGEFRIRNFGLTPPTQPQPSTLTIGSRSYQIAGPNAYGGMGSSSPSFGAALSVPTGEAVLYEIEGSEGSTFHARRPWASPPPSDGVMTPVPLDFSSQPWTIQGTSRQDIISGGTQADTIFSRDGNDRIYGRGGADTIAAGGGNDVVFFITPEALATATAIDGGEGQDTLAFGRVVGFDFTTSSTDTPLNVDVMTIGIAVGFENVIGGLANDTVLGNNDANGLLGSSGSDTIHGREGDDTLYGDYEVLFPAWGTGDGFFGYTSNMIDRSIFDQNGTGHDTLLGGAGRDRLFGEGGNDLLDGGTGADIHTGGAGFDTFVLRSGDGGATAAEADVITDFQDGVDVFGLADGLNFQSLVIAQGNGSDTATTNTVIRTTAGEILVVVNNVQATSITVLDFQQQT